MAIETQTAQFPTSGGENPGSGGGPAATPSGGPPASPPPGNSPSGVLPEDTTLAEKLAAEMAGLSLLNSPLAGANQNPILVTQPKSNTALYIVLIVGAGLAFWYIKKHNADHV